MSGSVPSVCQSARSDNERTHVALKIFFARCPPAPHPINLQAHITCHSALSNVYMFTPQAASPLCIVHGPFGCGKSSLLVALIHYLLAQRGQEGSALKGCRVLLSAHTNIAVDRLMTGLMDTGCTGDSPQA